MPSAAFWAATVLTLGLFIICVPVFIFEITHGFPSLTSLGQLNVFVGFPDAIRTAFIIIYNNLLEFLRTLFAFQENISRYAVLLTNVVMIAFLALLIHKRRRGLGRQKISKRQDEI